jgi:hypothetical protein
VWVSILSLKGVAYKGIAKTFLGFRHLRNGCFCCRWILVSNHSYGYTISGLANGVLAHMIRLLQITISELFPYYQIVVSAGNSRNLVHPQITAKIGYDLLTGSTLSKNCLVVGAVSMFIIMLILQML